MTKQIVWIDDDYDLIGNLMVRVREAGYHVIKLRTYAEAIAQADTLRTSDLLVLDIILPPGEGGDESREPDFYTGLTLLKTLQDAHQFDRPVLVCSVVTQRDVIEELEQRGARVLYKPELSATQLKQEIEAMLDG